MIAVLAVETGIAPDVLLSDPEMLEAIAWVVVERAKAAGKEPGPDVSGLAARMSGAG